MNNVVLSARGLSKSYYEVGEAVSVLSDLDLTLCSGEIIAIIGASGSGKSTLLHALGGLGPLDSGQVLVQVDPAQHLYEDLARLSEKQRCQFRNRYLGFIYQFHHLLPEFTVLENVAMPLWLGRMCKKEGCEQARVMLEKVGLGSRCHHRPAEISGGERQRVAIARALVTRPICILADELTGNLDRGTASNIMALLRTLTLEMRSAVVLVTHDLTIAALCDQQYRLEAGTLRASG